MLGNEVSAMALIRARMPTKRFALPVLVLLGVLVAAPLAWGSDGSFRRALRPYVGRLTADIGYLSNFSTPSKRAAIGALDRLSKVHNDLAGATQAATHQQASSTSGRTGRTQVLAGLREATTAASDARASAAAARSGNRSAAKRHQRQEQRDINKAIPQFESGGKLLHMF